MQFDIQHPILGNADAQNATGLTRTSSGGKTGQSVDFAARNGADLCESEPDLKSRRL